MICTKCGHGFGACRCPDMDDRLKRVAFAPDSAVAFKWCRACDKHYARCKCESPDYFIVHRGQDIAIPSGRE
jgi:hypothetical protein